VKVKYKNQERVLTLLVSEIYLYSTRVHGSEGGLGNRGVQQIHQTKSPQVRFSYDRINIRY